MNDVDLKSEVQTAEDVVQKSISKQDEATPVATGESTSHSDKSPKIRTEEMSDQIPGKRRKHRHHGHKRAHKQYDELDEDESSLYQPTYDPWRRTCFILD